MTRRTPRLLALEARLAPAIATWDGGGADNHWTTAANWAGDVAPNPGDQLVFPDGAAQLTNVNDFASGTTFQSLAITGSYYLLNGNIIALAAGVTANVPVAGSSSEIALSLGGMGGVTNAGDGDLKLSGANTYIG